MLARRRPGAIDPNGNLQMNPNSQHQLWSLWVFTVTPGDIRRNPSWDIVKNNCARFAVAHFGSTGQMKVERQASVSETYGVRTRWIVRVRVENAPVHDPSYRNHTVQKWAKFFAQGFGTGTHTHCDTKLEAGDKQDGTPPDQLIILPPLPVESM